MFLEGWLEELRQEGCDEAGDSLETAERQLEECARQRDSCIDACVTTIGQGETLLQELSAFKPDLRNELEGFKRQTDYRHLDPRPRGLGENHIKLISTRHAYNAGHNLSFGVIRAAFSPNVVKSLKPPLWKFQGKWAYTWTLEMVRERSSSGYKRDVYNWRRAGHWKWFSYRHQADKWLLSPLAGRWCVHPHALMAQIINNPGISLVLWVY
ncbi:hypothetical protein J6590_039261 [Homalodisca vitripennis]|nr:hypothetical protein J6590_039261 [Homalodisca vitripennis]